MLRLTYVLAQRFPCPAGKRWGCSPQVFIYPWRPPRNMNSQASLINSLPSYHSRELADRDALNSKTGLQSVDWLEAYISEPANEPVLTCGAMLSNNAQLPPDHIVRLRCLYADKVSLHYVFPTSGRLQFSAFLKVGLLQDMLCIFNADKREFSSIITLGKNVCGHPTIVHGGLTAAIVDETLGGLNYLMKKRGMLDPGPAFTVHMVMDWKKVCLVTVCVC